ncbi:poly(A) RNA polymerase GLD2-like [Elysia marginata]|uniref:Poly(A) RNA polymerase GLD2-like n=1 Tax=Elysia marginata TaxID=1093978 RepID=A0AAV4J2V4_9GAST|nr:poly(A) RNA polymerase GLD2-like [Elysia marginata]
MIVRTGRFYLGFIMNSRANSQRQSQNRCSNEIPSFEKGKHSSLLPKDHSHQPTKPQASTSERLQDRDNSITTRDNDKELDHGRGQNHQMSEEDLKKKLLLRKSLLSVLTGAFPNCRLFMVGSSMTGFATRTSDVDMCLMISQDQVDQKRDAALILSSIARALKSCSFVRNSQVIRAKVPILKFYDQVS